ncbi:MAG: GNAT family N-acetyltransferase [Hyphomicrobiaceae bacterium]|nr:GNAT family N-acetyltransferase [Hyphomicrobiaceae bacterium]
MTLQASPKSAPQPLAPPARTGRAAAMPASAGLSVDVVRSRAGFDALEAEWNALFQRCGRGSAVYQAFNWNRHWADAYLASTDDCSLAILAMRQAGTLVAVWPLVLTRMLGARLVEWMGCPVSQYGDVLIAPEADTSAVLAAGWAAIRTTLRADALHLRKVRADAHIAPLLRTHAASVTFRTEAPCLDIAGAPDLATFETRYSSKARKNRRRLARRLADLGEVRFEHLRDCPEAGAAAREAVLLRQRTLAETGRVSIAMQDERYARFFAAAAGGHQPCGTRVTRILVGGRLAASSIDITAHGHRAAHLIAHDLAFDACGPGVSMIGDWLRSAFEDRVAVLDLLAPAHTYKWDWADAAMQVCDYAVATSALGRAVVVPCLANLRPRVKTAVERFARWRAGTHARGDRARDDQGKD